jgi:hypothetical protein
MSKVVALAILSLDGYVAKQVTASVGCSTGRS